MKNSYKCFVFVYDSGREVYTDLEDFEHSSDESMAVLTGPMVSSMAGYVDLLNEEWRVVRCNKSVFVFSRRDDMRFFAMSSNGENDLMLIRQIQHMEDILLQLYSPAVFSSSFTRLSLTSQKKRLTKIFKTVKKYFSTQPNYLLLSLRIIPIKRNSFDENLIREVGNLEFFITRNQLTFFIYLKLVVSKNIDIHYILIFLNTQLLLNLTIVNNLPFLTTQNLFCINEYVLSQFSPGIFSFF